MKFSVFSTAIFLLISAGFFVQSSDTSSYPIELPPSTIEPRRNHVASHLEKRKSTKGNKKDCSKVVCALKLKPCPKACPQTCGYINSPNPCCPLLGKPTCPDL